MFSSRSSKIWLPTITVWLGLYFITGTSAGVIHLSMGHDITRLPYYCKSRCSCNITDDTTGLITTCTTSKNMYIPIHPNTTQLTVKRANIRKVQVSFFKGLYNLELLNLSYCNINNIEIGSFQDLYNLKALYLEGNDFTTLQTALPPGVFKGLTNVTVLTLNNCIQMWVYAASRIKNETFADLVSLKELTIDGLYKINFDEGFKSLTNFKSLVLSGYRGMCKIEELTNESFIGLDYLEHLTMVNCGINVVSSDSFLPLKNLRYLDMSENKHLEFAEFGKAAYGLTFTNISVLKINSIHDPNRAGTEINPDDLQYFKDIPLKRLYMERNGIEYMLNGFGVQFPKTLEYISIRENRLYFTDIFLQQLVYSNPNLVEIDLSDQTLIYRPFPATDIRQGYRNRDNRKNIGSRGRTRIKRFSYNRKYWSDPTNVSLSLKTLKYSGSYSKMSIIDLSTTMNKITYMDLSRNYFPVMVGVELNALKALQHLNLSSNLIEVIENDKVFTPLERLQVLDLHNNILGNTLELDVSLFHNLKHLQWLDLSINRIYRVNRFAFKGLSSLQSLDLSNNHLSDLDCDLSTLESLRNLNLANNRIHSVSVRTRKTLDLMAKVDEVKLDLSLNDFVCNCDTLSFIRWLLESPVVFIEKETYYCSFKNGTVRYFNASQTLVADLEKDCRSYLAIFIGGAAGGSFLVAFILCYLVYRYRWKLRYLYYMAKVKIDRHRDDHKDEYFDYDVFLSYADFDRPFVIKEMVENLEKAEGIRLCIRDRDFEIGEMVAVNISRAIRTSRKTLLIVSRHFLKNKWCNFEMNIARMEAIHMHRKLLVVLFMENVPANALPIELIDILREFHSTDVPEDEYLKPAFWQTCLGLFKD